MTFMQDVSSFRRKASARMDLVRAKISLDLLSRIVLRTPVDLGRARGNWQTTIGAPAQGTVEAFDPSGQATISNAAAVLENVAGDQVVWMTNNLPYIKRLEEGWSGQAPAGMVAVTIAEYPLVVQRSAAEAKRETR